MARRPHVPTEIQRREVSAYAAVGTPHHDIAKLVGIDTKTLLKWYRDELDTGKARANAQVAKTLFQQAIGGNITAAIFWMKAQAGWRDRPSFEDFGEAPSPIADGLKAARDRAATTAQQGTEWAGVLQRKQLQ